MGVLWRAPCISRAIETGVFPVACSVNGVYQFLSALLCMRCCLDIKSRAKEKTALTLTPLFGCLINMYPDPALPRDSLGDLPPL